MIKILLIGNNRSTLHRAVCVKFRIYNTMVPYCTRDHNRFSLKSIAFNHLHIFIAQVIITQYISQLIHITFIAVSIKSKLLNLFRRKVTKHGCCLLWHHIAIAYLISSTLGSRQARCGRVKGPITYLIAKVRVTVLIIL